MRKLKTILFVVLFLVGLGYYGYRNDKKKENEKIEKAEELRITKEQERLAVQAKRDSSNHYLDLAREEVDNKKYKQALVYLDSSLIIHPKNFVAKYEKGLTLKKRKKYKEAISIFDDLSNFTSNYESEVHLEKGRCLLKLGKKEEAILNIYYSVELKNEVAQKLYNKINPIRKELIGYRRRCCDGSTSSSTGKGTCSSHGGVCIWNEPIYVDRREYIIR